MLQRSNSALGSGAWAWQAAQVIAPLIGLTYLHATCDIGAPLQVAAAQGPPRHAGGVPLVGKAPQATQGVARAC